MSHYTQSYKGLPRKEADQRAIADIKEFLSPKQWAAIRQLAIGTSDFRGINFALGFMGVQGYPVHAFGRAYCLAAYRAWMAADPDPVPTDEQGYAAAVPAAA